MAKRKQEEPEQFYEYDREQLVQREDGSYAPIDPADTESAIELLAPEAITAKIRQQKISALWAHVGKLIEARSPIDAVAVAETYGIAADHPVYGEENQVIIDRIFARAFEAGAREAMARALSGQSSDWRRVPDLFS